MRIPLSAFSESISYAKGVECSSRQEELISASVVPEHEAPLRAAPDALSDLLIGDSPAMMGLKQFVRRVAPTHVTVLITGETGSGKECVAQLLHGLSGRRGKALVSINCAAVPESLLEGELFGYERGAFTGAQTAYPGKLKLADEGTLFLDEIGDMSPQAQAKILRAIESREIFRLGARRSTPFDVRIVAATNQPLTSLVSAGCFRKDLFYRLNVAHIHVPSLREHKEDIPALASHYVNMFNRAFRRSVEGLDEAALAELMSYSWPGNVRELRNAIEVAFIKAERDTIGVGDLPDALRGLESTEVAQPVATYSERQLLVDTLQRLRWNKTVAARELHWSRMTLYRKLAKYHIRIIESASMNLNQAA